MTLISRRHLLAAGSAAAGLAVLGQPALALDVAELNKPPAIGEMFLGNPDAKVTVIEYASATCPHCAAFHADAWKKLKTEYVDTNKVKFVFREFPLNDAALAAFMIARALPKESYFPVIGIYFDTLQEWTKDNWVEGLFNIAKQAGMTREKFDATLKDEQLARAILAIREDGAKFGVQGTPSFFVNGELYTGEDTFDAMKAKIDPLL